MMAHVERYVVSYRLTTHALVVRAVLVGTLATVALSGECASRVRALHTVAGRGPVGQARDRVSPAADSR